MTDATEPAAEPPPVVKSDRELELEERLRKLEAALAERPAPETYEEAVAARVMAKLSAIAGEAHNGADSDRVLVLATSADSQSLAVPPPPGAVLHPPKPPAEPAQKRWFLTQLWAEIKLIGRMYLDPHYRVSRLTQFALPGIALLLVLNYLFFSVWVNISFLSPVVERLLVVFLGILGYKLMVREIARYREVLEYMARYGRQ